MQKVARRPRREVRFYAAGVEVTPEQFWAAVRLAGGVATIVAHDPQPAESGYRLTPAGEAALRRAEEQG